MQVLKNEKYILGVGISINPSSRFSTDTFINPTNIIVFDGKRKYWAYLLEIYYGYQFSYGKFFLQIQGDVNFGFQPRYKSYFTDNRYVNDKLVYSYANTDSYPNIYTVSIFFYNNFFYKLTNRLSIGLGVKGGLNNQFIKGEFRREYLENNVYTTRNFKSNRNDVSFDFMNSLTVLYTFKK